MGKKGMILTTSVVVSFILFILMSALIVNVMFHLKFKGRGEELTSARYISFAGANTALFNVTGDWSWYDKLREGVNVTLEGKEIILKLDDVPQENETLITYKRLTSFVQVGPVKVETQVILRKEGTALIPVAYNFN